SARNVRHSRWNNWISVRCGAGGELSGEGRRGRGDRRAEVSVQCADGECRTCAGTQWRRRTSAGDDWRRSEHGGRVLEAGRYIVYGSGGCRDAADERIDRVQASRAFELDRRIGSGHPRLAYPVAEDIHRRRTQIRFNVTSKSQNRDLGTLLSGDV